VSITPETYQRLIVEASLDALVAISPDGKVLFWNPGAERIFGYSAHEAVGQQLNELIVPRDRVKESEEALKKAHSTGSAVFESIRRCKDGSLVYVDVSTKAVHDDKGRVQFFSVSKKDVTYFKVLRDAKVLETRFRGLLDSTPDAIVIINNTGRIVLINKQGETLFRYTREELVGQPIELLLPKRYREKHVGYRTDYFSEPRTRSMGAGLELYGMLKDGVEFPVEISLSPLETDEGMVAIAAIRDITLRKKAEAKFKGLLESSPDAMVIIDASGIMVLVNSQLERLFGFSRQELLGQPMEMLVPARFRPNHPEKRKSYFADPRPRPMGSGMELAGQCKDGREVPVEISLSPMETEEGLLVMAAVRDITDRKAAEIALHRKNEELAEQNRRVEAATRLKSEFLANMSHELRTPLNAIIGFASLMHGGKVGPVSAPHKEYLSDILTSSRHLLQLINDVLDLSKVESGKMTFHPEPVDLAKLIDEVRDILHPMASSKQIVIKAHIDPLAHAAHLDPARLKQVLYNYLSNALKFTPDAGRVELRVLAEGAEFIRIEVEDSGIGIRQEDMDRLFIEFQQLDSSTGKKFQGTGLGLALTKRIVEAQGGHIGVRSVPDKGSVFIAVLRKNQAAEPVGTAPSHSGVQR
jgi:PAS domain S-box-containing protein